MVSGFVNFEQEGINIQIESKERVPALFTLTIVLIPGIGLHDVPEAPGEAQGTVMAKTGHTFIPSLALISLMRIHKSLKAALSLAVQL